MLILFIISPRSYEDGTSGNKLKLNPFLITSIHNTIRNSVKSTEYKFSKTLY